MRRGELDSKIAGVLCAVAILVVALGHLANLRVDPVPPTPAPVVVPDVPPAPPEPQSEPAMVIVTDATGRRISDEAVEAVAGKLAVGSWRVQAIPKPGDTGWLRVLTVSEGDGPPVIIPTPVPPGPVVVPTPPPAVQATAATYVYEKGDTGIPSPVLAALNRLNRERKILATLHEVDTTDGTGDVPDQYRVAVVAAKTAGLPSLVVTAGDVVVKVVKDPRTLEAVMEAVP